ncbi:MAG: LamG domain-containing protein [Bryobacteraceae bacterium]|nr:LamG domain-containing protein [Bryobacteraceae bacterium]
MRWLIAVFTISGVLTGAPIPASLRPNLLFHASFDKGVDADVARGDAKIHSAPDFKPEASAKPGLGDVDAVIEKGAGVGGSDALRFRSKNTRALFFRGDRNIKPSAGTISFWMRLDPEKDLAPGFSDPIQVTDKTYNDSAIWVDFSKDEKPRHFRLGVFGRLKDWNPSDTPPDKNPDFLRRLVVIERPSFSNNHWTHVAITWTGLDAGGGKAALYVDGKPVSTAKEIRERFEWEPARLGIRLGLSYTGLMDEVAVFDRALSDSEIGALHGAGSGR